LSVGDLAPYWLDLPCRAYDALVTSHQVATPRQTRRVLVVSAGNICRSPTAEVVLRTRGAGHPAVELEVRLARNAQLERRQAYPPHNDPHRRGT
jgi:hypothetical protein